MSYSLMPFRTIRKRLALLFPYPPMPSPVGHEESTLTTRSRRPPLASSPCTPKIQNRILPLCDSTLPHIVSTSVARHGDPDLGRDTASLVAAQGAPNSSSRSLTIATWWSPRLSMMWFRRATSSRHLTVRSPKEMLSAECQPRRLGSGDKPGAGTSTRTLAGLCSPSPMLTLSIATTERRVPTRRASIPTAGTFSMGGLEPDRWVTGPKPGGPSGFGSDVASRSLAAAISTGSMATCTVGQATIGKSFARKVAISCPGRSSTVARHTGGSSGG